MQRRTFLLAVGTFAATLASAAPRAWADALDDIMARGTLRVAVPQDFAPFGSVGPDMSLQGYDIDMARLVAKGMGVKVELVPVTSGNRIPYLQTNKVDLVISSMGKNPEREKVVDFSSAYAPFYSGAFAPPSVVVTKPEDLAGKTVAVLRGSNEDLLLTKLAPPEAVIKRYEDNNGTISAFLSGQVEVIVTGNTAAAAIMARNTARKPELKFKIADSPCYVGMNKDQPKLLAKVNEIIATAKADGTLSAISEKWLGVPLPANF